MEELEKMLDDLQALRAKRDNLVDMMDDLIDTKRAELAAAMKAANVPKLQTPKATAYYQKHTKVVVKDWVQVSKFVVENNATDILEKRIAVGALEKRMDAGESIPGVTLEKSRQLTIRAASKGKDNAESE